MKSRITTNQNIHRVTGTKKKVRIQEKYKWKSSNHKTKSRSKEQRRTKKINWETRFKVAINTYLLIISLNANGESAPNQKDRVAG